MTRRLHSDMEDMKLLKKDLLDRAVRLDASVKDQVELLDHAVSAKLDKHLTDRYCECHCGRVDRGLE